MPVPPLSRVFCLRGPPLFPCRSPGQGRSLPSGCAPRPRRRCGRTCETGSASPRRVCPAPRRPPRLRREFPCVPRSPGCGGLRRVPRGIRKQVADDLDYAPTVRHHQGQVRPQVNVEVVPAPRALQGVPGSVHQRDHLCGLRVDRQGSGLDAGHVQQVADQLPHVVGLVDDDPVELGASPQGPCPTRRPGGRSPSP